MCEVIGKTNKKIDITDIQDGTLIRGKKMLTLISIKMWIKVPTAGCYNGIDLKKMDFHI